jgi:DTW domain-containing protein YfiP
MPRELCQKCNYPVKTCLCRFIEPVKHETKILVLQHPSEVNNKKNTIRVLSLLTDNIQIFVGESEEDFIQVKSLLNQANTNYFLLYPSEQAKTWDEYYAQNSSKNDKTTADNVLIVLDGTWRKAKKIHLCNQWLENIPNLTLNSTRKTNYGIRKSTVELGLSSIEAIAFALEDMENVSVTPFINALNGLKAQFIQLMPTAVKQRYDV